MKIGSFGIRREGHKLVVSNIPEKWHTKFKIAGATISIVELGIALFGMYSAITGFPFDLPIITGALAILVLIELGRPDIEILHNITYTSPPVSLGPGSPSRRHHDPPIEMVEWHYLDEDGGQIPNEELGLHGSEAVELEIPDGNRRMLGESGEASFSLGLPYPARMIKFSGETKGHDYDELNDAEELTDEEDIQQALVQDKASLSFEIPRAKLFSLGRIFREDAADDSKSIEFVSTEKNLEFRYSQPTYAHTLAVSKVDIDVANRYHVVLQWEPGELGMHIGPLE